MYIFPIKKSWVTLLAFLLVAACARSPESQKARHLESANRYMEKHQYREAVIEYRNVLRFDRSNGHAIRQLGLAHYQLGEMAQAYQYLLKAEELVPTDLDVRLKLGTIRGTRGGRVCSGPRARQHGRSRAPWERGHDSPGNR